MKFEKTAKRLSMALERKGMKAIELSKLSGVGKSSISQYLKGKHAPGNISAGKMAQVLSVNPVWLMGYDVPMITPLKHPGEMGYVAESISLDMQEASAKIELLNENNRKRVLQYMESLYQIQAAEEELQ